jgi:hypothetical protein
MERPKMPGKPENRESKKGMAKESGHPSSVKSIEHVGSSSSHGIRFKAFGDHPDKSKVRSPGG